MAAQNNSMGRHENDYTAQQQQQHSPVHQQGYSNDQIWNNNNNSNNDNSGIHQPRPQHLVNPHDRPEVLRSPPPSDVGYSGPPISGQAVGSEEDRRYGRPPSYDAGGSSTGHVNMGGSGGYRNEKAGYGR